MLTRCYTEGMATVTFETMKFVERLKAAGIPEAQAKAFAEAQREFSPRRSIRASLRTPIWNASSAN